jgi:hypothetical protein
LEKLVRLNEEWILLKKAPNNDHWMGSDDLHNAILCWLSVKWRRDVLR